MDDELAEFVRSRHRALLQRAFLLTGDRAHAEDLVQDSLARLWLAWSRHPVDNPDAYLRKVMLHASISRWRRHRPWDVVSQASPDSTEDPTGDATAGFDEHDRVWGWVQQLPPRQRAVVVLRYYEDLTEPEICAALDVTPGTVRSQMAKARDKLRILLADSEGAPL